MCGGSNNRVMSFSQAKSVTSKFYVLSLIHNQCVTHGLSAVCLVTIFSRKAYFHHRLHLHTPGAPSPGTDGIVPFGCCPGTDGIVPFGCCPGTDGIVPFGCCPGTEGIVPFGCCPGTDGIVPFGCCPGTDGIVPFRENDP